ncbi:MAG: BMP family ABC transporter substrate-binding protein [Actinobacteria bacterium]|nr:BMP family ABC transporter substrate-binding protein [Actinomycetota bacterium]
MAVAALALFAVGCGSSSSSSSTTTTTTTESSESSSSGTSSSSGEPLKAVWLFNGNISNGGFTKIADNARLAVQKEFGSEVETSYRESVPESPQALQVIEGQIQEGAKLIVATSFGFNRYIQQAAEKNPEVKFLQYQGATVLPNLSQYNLDTSTSWYLAGMAAGAASKSTKLGYVGAFPYPDFLNHVNAFVLGAQRTHPGATVQVTWVSSFYDPAKERLASQALISSGATAIANDQDDPAAGQYADSKGIPWVGSAEDQRKFGPKTNLTSVTWTWDKYEIEVVKSILENKWKAQSVILGMKEGATDIVLPIGAGGKAQKEIEKVRQEMKAGTFNVYEGPVKDQSGEVKVPAGKSLKPEQIQEMNWLVEGAIGSAGETGGE